VIYVDGQFGLEDPQLVEQALGVVKVGQRGGRSPRACAASARVPRGRSRTPGAAPARRVQDFGRGRSPGRLARYHPGTEYAMARWCRARASHTGSPAPDSRPTAAWASRSAVGTAPQHPEGIGPADSGSGRPGTPLLSPHQGVQDRQAALASARPEAGPRPGSRGCRTPDPGLPPLRANRRAFSELPRSRRLCHRNAAAPTPAALVRERPPAPPSGSAPAPGGRRPGLPTGANKARASSSSGCQVRGTVSETTDIYES